MPYGGKRGLNVGMDYLERFAVKVFKSHWAGVLRAIEVGQETYAQRYSHCFEAGTEAWRKKLAERFYGMPHALEMARLSDKSILERMSCYLLRAVEFALYEHHDEPEGQKDFIRRIVGHEYVIFSSSQCQRMDDYDEHWDDLWVAPYPERVTYDDWYERTFGDGFFSHGTFLLMKSTGEDFPEDEIDCLRASIMANIDGNDLDYSLWWFECEPLEKNRIWIKVYELDHDDYIEDILSFMAEMTEEQLHALAVKTVDYLAEDKKKRPLVKVLSSMANSEYSVRNAMARILQEAGDNAVIRKIEGFACKISGRKDRDYHRSVNF